MSMTLQPLLFQSLETVLRHAGQDLFQASRAPAPSRRGGSFRGETPSRYCFGNEDESRMNTNRHEYGWSPSTTSGARMLLQYCDVGVTTSWEKGPPGARASRPHKSWYSLTHLLDPDRTATAPWLCFGRAQAVPAGSVAGCRIAGKLSGTQRDSMRAGRPRSRVAPPPITLAPQGGTRRLAGPQPMLNRFSTY